MRMYDIIAKKRDGGVLTEDEIRFFIAGVTADTIPNYQSSALLMAIYLRGMTETETAQLTMAMAESGHSVDLSPIAGIKVDKHSTGGVGDKTTLVVAPLVAACGARVAKMSGRGLGHTGGTLDKLESIPGLSTALTEEALFAQVNRIGVAVAGATGMLAPADKKLYALRDVTATVSCLPLIASSIMSKKLASGSDCILLDVTMGSGAFMKTRREAEALAQAMVAIGEHHGRRTAAFLTDMDTPLGAGVGNSIEVEEAVDTLRGRGPADLDAVCRALAVQMLVLACAGTREHCCAAVEQALGSGAALQKLKEMVSAQGGDARALEDWSRMPQARCRRRILAEKNGFLSRMDTEKIGEVAVMLGAGRETMDSVIDPAAGIYVRKKTGEAVHQGEVLAELLAAEEKLFEPAETAYRAALSFSDTPVSPRPLVSALVDADGVHNAW